MSQFLLAHMIEITEYYENNAKASSDGKEQTKFLSTGGIRNNRKVTISTDDQAWKEFLGDDFQGKKNFKQGIYVKHVLGIGLEKITYV